MNKKAIIFDLDGVIVHTDQYHYLAWKAVADKLGLEFDEKINNRLRGVSRMESLDIILNHNNLKVSDAKKIELAEEKNEIYKTYLMEMTSENVDITVIEVLKMLKNMDIKLAIGSSSKNANLILEQTKLLCFFDTVVDGNCIKNSKPDPEVFLQASDKLGFSPEECFVVEDAEAGIEAGKSGGFQTIAIGEVASLGIGTYNISNFKEILELIKK